MLRPFIKTPFDSSSRVNRLMVWSVGLYAIFVLNFLEPFGITVGSFIPEYHLMLSSYGLVSSLTVALVVYLIHPWAIRTWFDSKEPAINATLWLAMLAFSVSLSNWLYSVVLQDLIRGWKNMYIVDSRFVVLMPKFLALYGLWAIFILANLFMVNRTRTEQASKHQELEDTLTLYSENQSDKLKVSVLQLVCFKTCDNYLQVFYLDEANSLKRRMIRSSMKKIEDQLTGTQFYRCHQSHLVNLAYIKGLKKVKNSHFLEMAYMDFDVSVSRKHLKKIKSILAS